MVRVSFESVKSSINEKRLRFKVSEIGDVYSGHLTVSRGAYMVEYDADNTPVSILRECVDRIVIQAYEDMLEGDA